MESKNTSISPTISTGIVSAETMRGSQIITQHTVRKMKAYMLYESELRTIGTFNTQVVLWTSIASIAITLILGCTWDSLTTVSADQSAVLTPSQIAAGRAQIGFIVACAVVAMGSIAMAIYYHRSRQSEFQRIQSETMPS